MPRAPSTQQSGVRREGRRGHSSSRILPNVVLLPNPLRVQYYGSTAERDTTTGHERMTERFYRTCLPKVKTKNCSASLAQRREAILGSLADRRVRPELAGLTEDRLGFFPPLLGHQDQTQVVVGELHLGIELDGESQRLLGLLVAFEVVQRTIVGFASLEFLHFGRLLGRRARASEQRKRGEKQCRRDSVSS